MLQKLLWLCQTVYIGRLRKSDLIRLLPAEMSSRSPAGKLSKLSRRAAECGATRMDIQEAEGLPREMAEDALIALALRAQQDAIQHTLSQHDTTGTSPIPDAFFTAVLVL